MKSSMKKIGASLVVVMVMAFLLVPQVAGYAHAGDTGVTSPLYEVRVGQAEQAFAEMPNIAPETTGGVNGEAGVSPELWSLGLSACILSGCVFSGCLGSGCKYSGCLGSGCKYSGCLGSGCGVSGCVGSGCAFSGCVFSYCLFCNN